MASAQRAKVSTWSSAGAGVGLAEQLEAGLVVLDRNAVLLAEDRAEIGVGAGHAEHAVVEIGFGDRQGEIGPQAVFDAVVGGGQQQLAAELLAGEIEIGAGGQQQRRRDALHGAALDQPDHGAAALGRASWPSGACPHLRRRRGFC